MPPQVRTYAATNIQALNSWIFVPEPRGRRAAAPPRKPADDDDLWVLPPHLGLLDPMARQVTLHALLCRVEMLGDLRRTTRNTTTKSINNKPARRTDDGNSPTTVGTTLLARMQASLQSVALSLYL